jgi:O-methyltransferase
MEKFLIHQRDRWYNKVYTEALAATQMEHSEARYARFWNMIQFFKQTEKVGGIIGEAGCWRGLSSYLLLAARDHGVDWFPKPKFLQIFDSFEGLSKPSRDDLGHYSEKDMQGRFSCPQHVVFNNLSQDEKFTRFGLAKGWIPNILTDSYAKKEVFSFVHIDVELYKPTYESLKFFWPRLNLGGVIVVDDCGYLSFPGSNKAMTKFCKEQKLNPIYLTTGNGVLIKR